MQANRKAAESRRLTSSRFSMKLLFTTPLLLSLNFCMQAADHAPIMAVRGKVASSYLNVLTPSQKRLSLPIDQTPKSSESSRRGIRRAASQSSEQLSMTSSAKLRESGSRLADSLGKQVKSLASSGKRSAAKKFKTELVKLVEEESVQEIYELLKDSKEDPEEALSDVKATCWKYMNTRSDDCGSDYIIRLTQLACAHGWSKLTEMTLNHSCAKKTPIVETCVDAALETGQWEIVGQALRSHKYGYKDAATTAILDAVGNRNIELIDVISKESVLPSDILKAVIVDVVHGWRDVNEDTKCDALKMLFRDIRLYKVMDIGVLNARLPSPKVLIFLLEHAFPAKEAVEHWLTMAVAEGKAKQEKILRKFAKRII